MAGYGAGVKIPARVMFVIVCAVALAACGSGSHATVAGCTRALIAQYPDESHIPAACNGLTQAQQKQAAGKAAAYELNKAFRGS